MIPLHLPQRLTAFTCTIDDAGRILLVRHERLGVVRWELPGGHVEPGETAIDAAARETHEETGVGVTVGPLIADCHHRWQDRTVNILYFRATPAGSAHPRPSEPDIHAVQWLNPDLLDPADTSPLAWPVVQHAAYDGPPQLHLEATHHRTSAGWEPTITRQRICLQTGQSGRRGRMNERS
jgi:8-oxo-dGTP diphosphatase